MRIYVADLGAYNNGLLHGKWIEARESVAEMQAEINELLAESPCPNVTRAKYECQECGKTTWRTQTGDSLPDEIECPECGYPVAMTGKPFASGEEYAIHDHEGLGELSEYAGLDEIARRVRLADLADDRDIPLDVILRFADDFCAKGADADEIESALDEQYRGCYESWRKMAEELTRDTQDMDALPDWLVNHIDWESIARDMKISGDLTAYESGGDLYFFWGN